MHLVEFSFICQLFHKINIKKTQPQIHLTLKSPHQKLVFVHSQMTGCPKSDKGGGPNSPMAFSSTIPSTALHLLNYLPFPRGNAEVNQKGFLRRLAWISASVPVDSRWIGLCQWSAQRSSQNRPQPTVQLWPRLIHALFLLGTDAESQRELGKKKKKKKEVELLVA